MTMKPPSAHEITTKGGRFWLTVQDGCRLWVKTDDGAAGSAQQRSEWRHSRVDYMFSLHLRLGPDGLVEPADARSPGVISRADYREPTYEQKQRLVLAVCREVTAWVGAHADVVTAERRAADAEALEYEIARVEYEIARVQRDIAERETELAAARQRLAVLINEQGAGERRTA